jgi:hypothetical protein
MQTTGLVELVHSVSIRPLDAELVSLEKCLGIFRGTFQELDD